MCIRFISVRNPGVLFESIRDGHGQLVVVWKGSIIWLLISRLLEGRYHGNQFIGEIGEISDLFLFVVLAFRSGVQYRNFDVRRLSGINFPALCRNLVRFCPATAETTMLKIITFATIRLTAKIGIWRQIS